MENFVSEEFPVGCEYLGWMVQVIYESAVEIRLKTKEDSLVAETGAMSGCPYCSAAENGAGRCGFD